MSQILDAWVEMRIWCVSNFGCIHPSKGCIHLSNGCIHLESLTRAKETKYTLIKYVKLKNQTIHSTFIQMVSGFHARLTASTTNQTNFVLLEVLFLIERTFLYFLNVISYLILDASIQRWIHPGCIQDLLDASRIHPHFRPSASQAF